jgi:hypothetical protein
MGEYPGFGVLLRRLLDHRELRAADLAGTGDGSRELESVLAGAPPTPQFLHWLAPSLGMHLPDLYVLADIEVPQELVPLDAEAGWHASKLVLDAGEPQAGQADELLALARSLPQQDRAEPYPPPKSYERYPPGFGSHLLRMFATRNLHWLSTVHVLYAVSLGHVYWSAAMAGQIGRARKEVTPALLPVVQLLRAEARARVRSG